jgi:molybdenum cofactor cytidylyltransferase
VLAVAILAAGESSRMGHPKALLPIGGVTFLERLLSVTTHPRVVCRRVVLGAHVEEITRRVAINAQDLVVNQDWESGPLSSLQAAIRTLPADTEGLLVAPVDHPMISAALIGALIAAFDASGKLIVVPRFAGRRGHPVTFRASLFPELLAAPLEIGARAVVRAHSNDVEEVPTIEEGVVLNLNDPAALERAMRAFTSSAPPSAGVAPSGTTKQ